jgi:glycosyltransferase involved in cell wall biosynthesis
LSNNAALISVVIPSHNRNLEIKKAIESVANQTENVAEIVVIDDGSDVPLTEDIFVSIPTSTDCILIRNSIPHGANYARNRGIEVSKSQYIAFLDDDDEFLPEKIRMIKNKITKYPDADVFYHGALIHMPIQGVEYNSRSRKIDNSLNFFRELLMGNFIGGTSMVVIKKQALIDCGMFDVNMPSRQDYELWLRLANHNKIFVFVDAVLTKHNCITSKNSITMSLEKMKKSTAMIESKYGDEFKILNDQEISIYESNIRKRIIHKALLNNDKGLALKEQLVEFKNKPSLRNFAFVLAITIGVNFTFKLRSVFNN